MPVSVYAFSFVNLKGEDFVLSLDDDLSLVLQELDILDKYYEEYKDIL